MGGVEFIFRADDLGSSISANCAIDAVTRAGLIKNVSVMAPGPHVFEAAQLLAGRKDICFGMHTTLNAEWDKLKWSPVLPLKQKSGLVDKNGYFLNNPSMFAGTKPQVEIVMTEVNAQLERLFSLGLDIKYVDSHMFPEAFIEGLDEAMEEFIQKKGLLDHMNYYISPLPSDCFLQDSEDVLSYIDTLPKGQYFSVSHPSFDTEEMRQTGNKFYSGEDVARARAREAEVFSGEKLSAALERAGYKGIRYDKAKPHKRLRVEDLKSLLI